MRERRTDHALLSISYIIFRILYLRKYSCRYVKDNEPVAAIMKKFEMMENIRKKEEDEKETNSSKVSLF